MYTHDFSLGVCMKVRTNFSLDKDVLSRFKKLVPNMSGEVEAFISRRVIELSGSDERARRVRYEELQSQYSKLVKKVAEKKDELSEIIPYFQEANDLLAGLGLKKDFSNADELIPKLRKQWDGGRPSEFIHQYISLVELARDKRLVERELDQFYSSSSSESPTPSQQPPPPPPCTAIALVQN